MNRASLGQEELLSQLSTVIILYIIDITFLLILWFVKYIFRIFLQPKDLEEFKTAFLHLL